MARLTPLLRRTEQDPRPIAIMLCGMCGSGKSTLAGQIRTSNPSFELLSIDRIIHQNHGLFDVDYPKDKYEEHSREARAEFRARLSKLLDAGRDVVLDRSFFAKEDRDAFRKVVQDSGSRAVFVYLKPMSKELIWQRVCERKLKPKTAESAFDVTSEMFEQWWNGFEVPLGEGEVVIDVE